MKRRENPIIDGCGIENIWSICYKKVGIAVLIILILAIASPVSSLYESDNYIIPKSTISSGGTYSISNSFSMTATIGQTSVNPAVGLL